MALCSTALQNTLCALSAVVAMLLPFFTNILALLGAMGFWPLTVFLPLEMHIRQAKIGKWSWQWTALQALSVLGLLVSIAAGLGAVVRIISDYQGYSPFQTKYTLD